MTSNNQAAWIDGVGKEIRIAPSDVGKPGPGEVLIKNRATAINPVEIAIQDYGYFTDKWPTLTGQETAGEVVEVGEGVTKVSKGQRVAIHVHGLLNKVPQNGGWQNYSIALAAATTPIPDSLSFEAATTLPMAISTAAHGLYSKSYLGLPLPSLNPQKTGKTLLVWGGSSGVGTAITQMAVASGLDVVTTASPKNFGLCKELGAKEVFDYSSDTVVDDLIAALKDTELVGAYDAISHEDTVTKIAKVLEQRGGGFIATSLPPPENLPSSVKASMAYAVMFITAQDDEGKKQLQAVLGDFLPAALQSGQIKPALKPIVVGHGLESIPAGIKRYKEGVSAAKVVVTL